jgi:nondiscriminating glutamyl-tRNA synthetase
VNYLVRLGWSLDAESEIIPLDVVVKNFGLDRVTKAPGNFDRQKLFWVQGEYMKQVPTAEKVERCVPYLKRAGLIGDTLDDATRAKVTAVIEASGDRIKLFSDVLAFATPFLKADPVYDPKAAEKSLKTPDAKTQLQGFRSVLAAAEPFDAPALKKALHDHVESHGLKPRTLVAAVRVAVTGSTFGFGLYESLALLGKDEVLRRIDLAMNLS